MQGLKEEQSSYSSEHAQLVGQFRRLGDAGPAYEIMKIDEDGTVHVEFVYNDERMTYPISEVLEDPVAKTIP